MDGKGTRETKKERKKLHEAAASINIFKFILLRNSISLELLAFIIVVRFGERRGREGDDAVQEEKYFSFVAFFIYFLFFSILFYRERYRQ